MEKYEIIKKYLDEYDYYGLLAGGAPRDEFVGEAHGLAEIISEQDSADEIAAKLANTLDTAFGEKLGAEKFGEIARKICAALENEE